MSQVFSSRLDVLVVENEQRTSKRTGKEYNHFKASCIVLDDEGKAITVGALRSDWIVPELRDQLKPGVRGVFRVTYGLRVADYGDDKGDIVAMVVGLVPEKAASAAPVKP